MNPQARENSVKIAFAIAAKEYVEEFPLLGNLAVFSKEEPLFFAPRAQMLMNIYRYKQKEILDEYGEHLDKENMDGVSRRCEELEEYDNLKVVMIDIKKKGRYKISARANGFFTRKMIIFDHEIAHLIADQAYSTSEGFADTRSAMLHVKRSAAETDVFEYLPYAKSFQVMMGSAIHYTSHNWFAVEKLAKKIDIAKLDRKEITAYAEQIDDLFSPKPSIIMDISEAYAETRKYYSEHKKYPLRLIATTMLENKNNEENYRAGKLFLTYPSRKQALAEKALLSEFWGSALAKMEAHEKASGFILNPVEAYDAKKGVDMIAEVIKTIKKNNETKP